MLSSGVFSAENFTEVMVDTDAIPRNKVEGSLVRGSFTQTSHDDSRGAQVPGLSVGLAGFWLRSRSQGRVWDRALHQALRSARTPLEFLSLSLLQKINKILKSN